MENKVYKKLNKHLTDIVASTKQENIEDLETLFWGVKHLIEFYDNKEQLDTEFDFDTTCCGFIYNNFREMCENLGIAVFENGSSLTLRKARPFENEEEFFNFIEPFVPYELDRIERAVLYRYQQIVFAEYQDMSVEMLYAFSDIKYIEKIIDSFTDSIKFGETDMAIRIAIENEGMLD